MAAVSTSLRERQSIFVHVSLIWIRGRYFEFISQVVFLIHIPPRPRRLFSGLRLSILLFGYFT